MKKKKKVYYKTKVMRFLYDLKGRACSKDKIGNACSMRKSAVDKALSTLRKEKKVGCLKIYSRTFPSRVLKSYWGAR